MHKNCIKPPINTLNDRMRVISMLKYTETWDARINIRFNIRGFRATTANFPYEYKIPDIKLTRDINIR
ncbi:hypothetical protein FACS1894152_0850 [Bacilli bacterium]|nr:hypothetical protein FACS1894152_0850 [Bacilli bacterium]